MPREAYSSEGRSTAVIMEEGHKAQSALLHAQQVAEDMYHAALVSWVGCRCELLYFKLRCRLLSAAVGLQSNQVWFITKRDSVLQEIFCVRDDVRILLLLSVKTVPEASKSSSWGSLQTFKGCVCLLFVLCFFRLALFRAVFLDTRFAL